MVAIARARANKHDLMTLSRDKHKIKSATASIVVVVVDSANYN